MYFMDGSLMLLLLIDALLPIALGLASPAVVTWTAPVDDDDDPSFLARRFRRLRSWVGVRYPGSPFCGIAPVVRFRFIFVIVSDG